MKIRRILCTILALVMVIGCFGAISVSADTLAEGGVVYVDATSGDDTKDGLTTANAVKTINAAIAVVNSADVDAATIKFIGTYNTPSDNFTETAHTATITYTGNDGNAALNFGRHFKMSGPVVFKNIKLGLSGSDARRLHFNSYKLVMDEGITVADNLNLQIESNYSSAVTLGNVDLTIKSGRYTHVNTTELNGTTVTGNVNVVVDGADTYIGQLHIGGNNETNASHTINGTTYVEIKNGTVRQLFIGSEKSGSSVSFNDLVYFKINGGGLADGGCFGGFDAGTATTTFAKGCIVDFSGYVDQGDPDDGANFLQSAKWKSMLNSNITDEAFKSAFKVTDVMATGMQTSDVASNKTNARFLVGLRDYENVKATIQVVAKYNDGTTDKQLTFTKDITNVYTSVQAGNGNATTTAADEGANYLIALTIKDVPTNVGDITFEVTPITVTNDGEPVNGPTSTFVYAPSAS